MKLLVVAPYPPCEDSNGLRARAWAEALAGPAGGEVQVLVAASEALPQRGGETPPEATYAPSVVVHRVWKSSDRSRAIVRSVLEESDRFRPDVVHLHFNYLTYGNPAKSFVVVARLLAGFSRRGVQTVVTLHSVVASPARYVALRWGFDIAFPRWIDRASALLSGRVLDRALQDAARVVVVSPQALQWLQEHTRSVGRRASYIALGSCPASATPPPSVGTPEDRATGTVRVTCVGRLAPYKGLEDLIRAAGVLSRQGRPVRVTIRGEVPTSYLSGPWYLRRLQRLVAAQAHGAVRLEAQYVQPAEYAQLQQEADVIVLPFRDDGIVGASGSVLDFGGMSSARLVLTDVPRLQGYREVRGVAYCPEGDPSRLAEAIWRSASSPPVDPRERQHDLVRQSTESVSGQYREEYLRLLGPGAPSGPAPRSHPAVAALGAALGLGDTGEGDGARNADLRVPGEGDRATRRAGLIPVSGLEQHPR